MFWSCFSQVWALENALELTIFYLKIYQNLMTNLLNSNFFLVFFGNVKKNMVLICYIALLPLKSTSLWTQESVVILFGSKQRIIS